THASDRISVNRLLFMDCYDCIITGYQVYQRQLAKQGLSAAIVDESAAQSRTFSQEELRALFEVNTTTLCDTHSAIKCTCDGTSTTARAKEHQAKQAAAAVAAAVREREAQEAGAGVGSGAAAEDGGGVRSATSGKAKDEHEGCAVDDGILRWAHLASVADSVDPIWCSVSSWLRDKFTTYLFSDHIINDSSKNTAEEDRDADAEALEVAEGKYQGDLTGGYGSDDVDYGDYE
ncbi:hypothetical protein Vafri_4483, partial [Volvox africanus]